MKPRFENPTLPLFHVKKYSPKQCFIFVNRPKNNWDMICLTLRNNNFSTISPYHYAVVNTRILTCDTSYQSKISPSFDWFHQDLKARLNDTHYEWLKFWRVRYQKNILTLTPKDKREISAKNKCGKCVPMGGLWFLLFLGNKLPFLKYEWVNVQFWKKLYILAPEMPLCNLCKFGYC